MKVLVDNSVLSDAKVAHLSIESGPPNTNRLLTIQARPLKEQQSRWKQDQIECLPTIARLEQKGSLSLCLYEEIIFEKQSSGQSFSRFSFGDLFSQVDFIRLPSPVRRGIFFPDSVLDPRHQLGLSHFVEWLCEGYSPRILRSPVVERVISAFEISNLQDCGTLKKMCRKVSKKHYADVFHLWAGHVNNIPWFLTTDKKLINLADQHHRALGRCVPISPEMLLEHLGVTERDPMPFEYGQRYSLSGNKE